MKLTKCENKHFYDADKFDACPHCEKKVATTQDRPGQTVSVKASTEPTPAFSTRNTFSPHTGSIWDQNVDKQTVSFMDEFNKPVEESLSVQTEKSFNQSVEVVQEYKEQAKADIEAVINEPLEEPVVEDKHDLNITAPSEPKNTLQSQISAVASHGPTEDLKTMAFYNFSDIEPVVGWLVCIIGEYLGQSFNLKTGQNFIGRALTMDVPLAQDTSVSREKHTIVTFDPQNCVFYVQPGDSGGLTYLNGNLLLAYQQLKAYEKIKIGNSEFIFIPCCGEQFTWGDYM